MNEARQSALVRELTLGLRARVLPLLGARAGRAQMTDAANAGGDVTFAIDEIAEIKSGTLFTATRSRGLEIRTVDGEQLPVSLSDNTDLSCLFWTFGFRDRTARRRTRLSDVVHSSRKSTAARAASKESCKRHRLA